MAHDLEQLKQDHPDVAKLFADDWLQYRKSEILPELTREAQSTCDRINRIYFEDTAEAERLFRELVPEAGEGVDFRPSIRLDYGLGLKIGDRTFINMDLLIVGGGPISIGSDCLIGPRVSIYTPNHAIARKPRLEGWQHNADVTIAAMPVPMEEASRFGILITDDANRITEFEEKPANPRSNLASMGIYIFSWKVLKEALIKLKDEPGCDFGKHIIPYCHNDGRRIFAYEYNGYWKDVGTLGSYWEANMELIDIIPEFNLYEEYWKIYTKSEKIPPQFISAEAKVGKSIIGEGTEIYGEVTNSVIGSGVVIEKGAVVRDSIIMQDSVIEADAVVDKAIVAEDVRIGAGARLGVGEYAPSKYDPKVYQFDLVTVGEHSVIPAGVEIGKNTAVSGVTEASDYPDGKLESGGYIVKAGGNV